MEKHMKSYELLSILHTQFNGHGLLVRDFARDYTKLQELLRGPLNKGNTDHRSYVMRAVWDHRSTPSSRNPQPYPKPLRAFVITPRQPRAIKGVCEARIGSLLRALCWRSAILQDCQVVFLAC